MKRIELGEKQEARLVKMYLSGTEMALIRERFGLDRHQMLRVLNRLGVTGADRANETARSPSQ